MKKLIIAILAIAALSTLALADHPSPSANAGGNMSDGSGHLTNSLPASIY